MMLVAVVPAVALSSIMLTVLHKGADVITIFMLGGMFCLQRWFGAGPFGTRFVRSDSLLD